MRKRPAIHVAIYGPLPAQFRRVIDKIPASWRRRCRFSLRASSKSDVQVSRAGLHIIWTRFTSHQLVQTVQARSEPWHFTPQWNVAALCAVLTARLGAGEPVGKGT